MNEDKNKIKDLVKESLAGLFEKSKKSKEANTEVKKDKGSEENKETTEKPLDQQDQTSIKNALDKDKNPLAPAISQVMHKVTGDSPDNATKRSQWVKKIAQTHGQGLTQNEKSSVEVELGLK